MSDEKIIRKIAVIFVTDVVGFSKLMEKNENQTLKSFRSCKEILENLFVEHGGRIFNTAGDSILAEFSSAVSAAICASEFQKLILERNGSLDTRAQMHFRIGLNMGDVIVEGDNLYGDGVNVAARLEALSQPDGVCLSKSIYDFVSQKVDLAFRDIGKQKVKNTIVHAFDISLDGISERNLSEALAGSLNAAASPPSIAVLPFKNMSSDEEQEYFADGVTEDIISNLSMWRAFPVVSRNSSFNFKNSSESSIEIAKKLGARYIVEGSVRKGGNKVRITASLIDAEEDQQIWTQRWDRSLEDIFDVQDEVSQEVAAMVSPTLRGQEAKKLNSRRTDSVGTWEKYVKALSKFNADAPFDEMEGYCEEIMAIDRKFIDNYFLYIKAMMKFRYTPEGYSQSDELEIKMTEMAKLAYDLDPDRPECVIYLAQGQMLRKNYLEAKKLLEKSLKINPFSADLTFQLGMAEVNLGNFKSSITLIEKTFEFDPTSKKVWTVALINVYVAAGRFETALKETTAALTESPQDTRLLGFSAFINGLLGNKKEAQESLKKYLARRPEIKTLADYEAIAPEFSLKQAREGMQVAGLK